eukprot:7501700-Pyramimonas_sp.AAC.1
MPMSESKSRENLLSPAARRVCYAGERLFTSQDGELKGCVGKSKHSGSSTVHTIGSLCEKSPPWGAHERSLSGNSTFNVQADNMLHSRVSPCV